MIIKTKQQKKKEKKEVDIAQRQLYYDFEGVMYLVQFDDISLKHSGYAITHDIDTSYKVTCNVDNVDKLKEKLNEVAHGKYQIRVLSFDLFYLSLHFKFVFVYFLYIFCKY